MANKLKIKKGDRVKVITGRDKGKIGDVLRVFPTEQRVVVSGVNMIKRHTKPNRNETGGIIEQARPRSTFPTWPCRPEIREADPSRLPLPRRRP